MASTPMNKKRKFVADGVFFAELNEVRAHHHWWRWSRTNIYFYWPPAARVSSSRCSPPAAAPRCPGCARCLWVALAATRP
jgi:hypothetical protein